MAWAGKLARGGGGGDALMTSRASLPYRLLSAEHADQKAARFSHTCLAPPTTATRPTPRLGMWATQPRSGSTPGQWRSWS